MPVSKPEIFLKYDKIIDEKLKVCKECHQVLPGQDLVVLVSDQDWQDHLNALPPMTRARLETFGVETFVTYLGIDYPCLAYRTYPFIKKSDVEKNQKNV